MAMCDGKHRFRSKTAALIEGSYIPVMMRPYRCPKCGGWHLSSKPLNKVGRKALA